MTLTKETSETVAPKKVDPNQNFLRVARAGNLAKVLDYLNSGTKIETCNANGLNALHLAAKEGHTAVVRELLMRNADPDACTKKGNTALHIASLAGQLDVVKLLIEKDAKVNCQSQNGFTPLYMAAQENHVEVVKFLLASGASQTLATTDGFTPLAVALQQGHEKVVAILLENDSRGRSRMPALHVAAKKDDVRSATLLLTSDSDPNHQAGSGFTALHIAAHYGSLGVASLLIEKGADVNFQARNNITPLHVAAKWGMLPVVQKLLEHGAEVDCKTRDGLTPLHCASRSGQYAVVDQLLGNNASFNLKSRSGLSPLHMATQGDHVDCARLLLTRGANLDDTTIDLLTPLHVAAHCGYTRVAKLLLDHRCMVNARALNGFTPLHIACKKNRIRVIELLLQFGCAVEASTESGLTPLHVAAFMGHNSVALLLLQHGADPNSLTVRSETPLHLAVRSGQAEAARALLRCGAQPDARAKDNQTPLHISSRLGNAEVTALLLQAGANPDATCKDNYTALHVAAREGHEDIAALLLDHKASLQLTTKKGATPLHNAAKYDKAGVAKLLLAKGADPNARGRNGLTPLHLAAHYNRIAATVALLEAKGNPNCVASNGYTPLHIAARKNNLELAGQLLAAGANPRAESKSGYAPLHLAAQEGHAEMCALLLSRGAGVDQASHNGITPLHLAAQEDRVSSAEVLVVQHGGQIDPQTKAGYTPLHTASFFGQAAMVRFLLRQGANANAVTLQKFAPLHVAAQQGHLQIVSQLLEAGADPNMRNSRNWTPAHIAKKQNYINIFELLRRVTTTIENWEEEIILEETIEISKPDTVAEHLMSDSEEEAGDAATLRQHKSRKTEPLDSVLDSDGRLNATTLMRSDSYTEWSSSADYLKDEMQYTTDRLESVIEATGPSEEEMQNSSSTDLLLTSPFYASTISNLAAKSVSQQTITEEPAEEQLNVPTIIETDKSTHLVEDEAESIKESDTQPTGDEFVMPEVDTQSNEDEIVIEAEPIKESGTQPIVKPEEEVATQPNEDEIVIEAEPTKAKIGHQFQPIDEEFDSHSIDPIDHTVRLASPSPIYDEIDLQPQRIALSHSKARPRQPKTGSGDAASVDETTNDIEKIGTLSSQKESAAMEQIEPSSYMSQYREPDALTPPENYITGKDNVPPQRVPVVSGFMVSFLVDARGGAMNASRCPGLRIIIPPSAASAPTRVTCRLMRPGRVSRPPQLNDGEGLACRILELGPTNAPFNGHVLLEVPHFASLRDREREIVVLRSETGETWKEHTVEATEQAVLDSVGGSFSPFETNEELRKRRVIRILTNSFPQYLALITRVRQESALIGPEGGVLSSTVVSQVQAVFPEGALTKKIRVAIQTLPVPADQVTRLLGPRLSVSPVVTIEPRRRKFHKPITLTIPLPRPASRGVASPGESPTLRLLCSITGGVQPATWEDITGSTPLSYVKDCVSFTTTVSARFWLMDCPNTTESAELAGRLYRDSFVVPYMARFVIFAKRHENNEAKLRCFCVTDDKVDKTLEIAEGFERKAESREVEVLDGRPQWVETVGNISAVTKTNDQLFLPFKAFRENRLAFNVRVKDTAQSSVGKVAFLKDPRPTKPTDSPSLKPICTLEVALPDYRQPTEPAFAPAAAAVTPARSAASGEDFIRPAANPHVPPPPPAPTTAEVEKSRKAKTEAYLGLIEAMDSLIPEPEIDIPDRDLSEAIEEDIPTESHNRAQRGAGFEGLLAKLDSMPSESMAPEAELPDEVLDVPRSVSASQAAAPVRSDLASGPCRESSATPTPEAPEKDLKSEARRLIEEMMEREAAGGNSQGTGSPAVVSGTDSKNSAQSVVATSDSADSLTLQEVLEEEFTTHALGKNKTALSLPKAAMPGNEKSASNGSTTIEETEITVTSGRVKASLESYSEEPEPGNCGVETAETVRNKSATVTTTVTTKTIESTMTTDCSDEMLETPERLPVSEDTESSNETNFSTDDDPVPHVVLMRRKSAITVMYDIEYHEQDLVPSYKKLKIVPECNEMRSTASQFLESELDRYPTVHCDDFNVTISAGIRENNSAHTVNSFADTVATTSTSSITLVETSLSKTENAQEPICEATSASESSVESGEKSLAVSEITDSAKDQENTLPAENSDANVTETPMCETTSVSECTAVSTEKSSTVSEITDSVKVQETLPAQSVDGNVTEKTVYKITSVSESLVVNTNDDVAEEPLYEIFGSSESTILSNQTSLRVSEVTDTRNVKGTLLAGIETQNSDGDFTEEQIYETANASKSTKVSFEGELKVNENTHSPNAHDALPALSNPQGSDDDGAGDDDDKTLSEVSDDQVENLDELVEMNSSEVTDETHAKKTITTTTIQEVQSEARRTQISYELEILENDRVPSYRHNRPNMYNPSEFRSTASQFLWEELENYRDAGLQRKLCETENLGQSVGSLLDEAVDMEDALVNQVREKRDAWQFECEQDTEDDEQEDESGSTLTKTKSKIKRRNRTHGSAQYYESSRNKLAKGSRSDLLTSPINQANFQYSEIVVDNTKTPKLETKSEGLGETGEIVSVVDSTFDRKILLRGTFVVDAEVGELSSDDLDDSDLEEKLLEDGAN